MVFNSYIFLLLFLPLCLIGWNVFNYLHKYQAAKAWLLFCSFVFCGYFNIVYALILIGNILINYMFFALLKRQETQSKKKVLLILGLVYNVGALLVFKYYNFFVENLNVIFGTEYLTRELILPLGISFYTFHQISFLVDAYRGEIQECGILDFSLYMAYFPKLVMGPIVRYNELMPQFSEQNRRAFDWNNFAKGIYVFTFGLVKKVLLANAFGTAADYGYQNLSALNSIEAVLVILSYTVQIYFDFSGYCDMALGVAKMMNVDLPINFNSPYKSITIIDFWDRWHISLTKFFTRYVYIPLGGNRKGTMRTYINTMIVFLVSGFWHGANWTFILWGALHGIFTILTKMCKKTVDKIPKAFNWLITFLFVNVSWIFFRADSISDAILLIKRVFSFEFGGLCRDLRISFRTPELRFFFDLFKVSSIPYSEYFYMMIFAAVSLIVLMKKNAVERMESFRSTWLRSVTTALFLVWCVFSFSGVSTFLYLNF